LSTTSEIGGVSENPGSALTAAASARASGPDAEKQKSSLVTSPSLPGELAGEQMVASV
jgi:hypothetical protein